MAWRAADFDRGLERPTSTAELAQSSQQGIAPLASAPARQPPQGPNSPPSGSSKPDSWMHADMQRDSPALRDRGGAIDLPKGFPPFPFDSGGDPSLARGWSRSPQGRGARARGVRVMEHIQLEMEPGMEELFRQGVSYVISGRLPNRRSDGASSTW